MAVQDVSLRRVLKLGFRAARAEIAGVGSSGFKSFFKRAREEVFGLCILERLALIVKVIGLSEAGPIDLAGEIAALGRFRLDRSWRQSWKQEAGS